jgi:hypothetical protein
MRWWRLPRGGGRPLAGDGHGVGVGAAADTATLLARRLGQLQSALAVTGNHGVPAEGEARG